MIGWVTRFMLPQLSGAPHLHLTGPKLKTPLQSRYSPLLQKFYILNLLSVFIVFSDIGVRLGQLFAPRRPLRPKRKERKVVGAQVCCTGVAIAPDLKLCKRKNEEMIVAVNAIYAIA